jgi:HSP20 family molecular chaperone IbpA
MTTLFPLTRMFETRGCSPEAWSDTDRTANLIPRADVLEGEKEYRIVLDLPGVQNDGLEINLEKQSLFVKAEKTSAVPEGFELRRHERAGNVQFSRTFNLGNAVDGEQVTAKLDNGVLQIILPKSDVSLARRIEVK